MKHVCPCRACGLTTVSIRKEISKGTKTLFYWYQCHCGLCGARSIRKSYARHHWNKDNADAQVMRELTEALKHSGIRQMQIVDQGGRCAEINDDGELRVKV